MTRLRGEFPLGVEADDALVACADALDGAGWEVRSVVARRITAYDGASGGTALEVNLRDDTRGATVVRFRASNRDASDGEVGAQLDRLRAGIEDAARGVVREREVREREAPRPGESRQRTVELAPEFREELQAVAARDRRSARVLRVLATALAVASTLILAEVTVTLIWQEPLSYVYAQRKQSELADRLDEIETRYRRDAQPPVSVSRPEPPPSLSRLASRLAATSENGEPLGRIRAPAIGLDAVVVEDTEGASLQKGPAHYRGTSLPGQRGTVGIAGHRTTYSAPFNDVNELNRGDGVTVRMPYGVFRYRVERRTIVSPTDIQVLDRVGYDRLAMTACHPLYSDAERIVVFARLTGKGRLGQALR